MIPRDRRPDTGRTERTGPAPQSCYGTAAGHELHMGMMILASAMRHSVGRPATGMGGGTKNPMERLCQPPSEPAFALYREQLNTAPPDGAKFVDNASHRETHFSLEIRLTVGHISQRSVLDKWQMQSERHSRE